MHFGHTLQKIRKNRCLTQKEVCDGIMKQGTYSRIENGQLDISAEQLAQIVERLNISLNEFLYIHQNYTATPRQLLFKDYVSIELTLPSELHKNRTIVERYLKKHPDPDIQLLLYSYDAIIVMTEQLDLEHVRSLSEKIWARLQKLDHWYINDLQLLCATILYFPLDTAIEVTKTAITRIDAYREYENDISHLKIYFQINLSNLYIEDRRFEECLQLLNDVHEQFGKQLTYQTLAFILVYKIICKHHLQLSYEDELQKLRMLEHLFNHEEVFTQLHQELETNIPGFLETEKVTAKN